MACNNSQKFKYRRFASFNGIVSVWFHAKAQSLQSCKGLLYSLRFLASLGEVFFKTRTYRFNQ